MPRTYEGDFDVEKGKRLIDNLDEEIADLKAKTATLTAERDDALKSSEEFKAAAAKTGDDRDKALEAALKRAEDAERTLAIKKHNLPDDVVAEFADYLTGSAEEVDAKAARLAARLAPPKPAEGEGEEEEPSEETEEPEAPRPPARPRPALKPGHGADDTGEPFDAAAAAKAIRERRYL